MFFSNLGEKLLAFTVNLKSKPVKCLEAVYFGRYVVAVLPTGYQKSREIKDGAYYCYCAYVLRISRYSDFLSVMPTNTGIFLRGLKLCRESRS